MTPEELDEARAREAWRIWCERDGITEFRFATIAARLAREGWTPPEYVVDPDVLAFREWWRTGEGAGDPWMTYLAGARMAREQERERAGPLLDYVKERAHYPDGVGGRALNVLAKYRGEA